MLCSSTRCAAIYDRRKEIRGWNLKSKCQYFLKFFLSEWEEKGGPMLNPRSLLLVFSSHESFPAKVRIVCAQRSDFAQLKKAQAAKDSEVDISELFECCIGL